MIDTITFVLHNINSESINLAPSEGGKNYKFNFNRLLYERLSEYESSYVVRNKQFLNETVLVNDDSDYFKRNNINQLGFVKRKGAIVDNFHKKDFFFYPMKGTVQTSSSNYNTKFSINENSDSITFELAIPKYLYNHNIAQFIPNAQSKRYTDNPFLFREFHGQVKHIRLRLIEFIYTFFNDLSEILNLPIIQKFDINNVEIKRLDLCYNQIFNSHEMVLDYINAQRKFYRTRIKANTNVKDDRDTSFYYRHSTDGFYFKIYAKHEEFLHSDYPKILKQNESFYNDNLKQILPTAKKIFETHFPDAFKKHNGNVQSLIFEYYKSYTKNLEHKEYCTQLEFLFPYKLHFLNSESKKILRYEMSFTSTYISTLYKRELFRKNDLNWKKLKKSHNLIKRYDLLLSQGSIEKAKQFKRFHNLTNDNRYHYEIIDKSLHKKHEFYLVTNDKIKKHETTFVDYQNVVMINNYRVNEIKEATLNDDLFKLLFKKFKQEIDYFQVKKVENTKTILEQIDIYNDKVEKKINSYIQTFGKHSFKKLTHTYKKNNGFSKLQRARLKIVLDKMNEGKSLDKIVLELGLKKTAFFSLKNDLEKFNIFKTSIKTKYNFQNVKTDFTHYYNLFFEDKKYNHKFFSNPDMISFDTIRNSMLDNYNKLTLHEKINSLTKRQNLYI